MDSTLASTPITSSDRLEYILFNHSQIEFLPLDPGAVDLQEYLSSPLATAPAVEVHPATAPAVEEVQEWLLHYEPALPKEDVESAKTTARRRLFDPLIR